MIGAPEEIRTPDPQIRSLVLYPAELRALAPGHNKTPRCQPCPQANAHGVASNRSIWMASPVMSGQVFRASTAEWELMPGPFAIATGGHSGAGLQEPSWEGRWLAAWHGLSCASRTAPVLEFDGAIRDGEPEGRANCAVHQPDFAPVRADQFGRDGQSETRTASTS